MWYKGFINPQKDHLLVKQYLATEADLVILQGIVYMICQRISLVMKEMNEKELANFFDEDVISPKRKQIKLWLRKKVAS